MHDNVRTLAQLIGRILAERWYRLQQTNAVAGATAQAGSADKASGRSAETRPIESIAEDTVRARPTRAGR